MFCNMTSFDSWSEPSKQHLFPTNSSCPCYGICNVFWFSGVWFLKWLTFHAWYIIYYHYLASKHHFCFLFNFCCQNYSLRWSCFQQTGRSGHRCICSEEWKKCNGNCSWVQNEENQQADLHRPCNLLQHAYCKIMKIPLVLLLGISVSCWVTCPRKYLLQFHIKFSSSYYIYLKINKTLSLVTQEM